MQRELSMIGSCWMHVHDVGAQLLEYWLHFNRIRPEIHGTHL